MIDWYIIEYVYPNAFTEFTKIMFPNVGLPSISILTYYDIKKLYKFFDKNGIFLTVEMITKDNWGFTITLIEGKTIVPLQDLKPNRESIEVEGFYECFKCLEKKLFVVN
jgi:hypothetical protein